MQAQGGPPQPRAKPLRPLNQERPINQSVIQPELLDVCYVLDPIKIDMGDRQPHLGGRIPLNDCKRRAWRLTHQPKGSEQPANERRLTRTKISKERDDIAWAKQRCKRSAYRFGRCRLREEQRHTTPFLRGSRMTKVVP
jgi:hypothetical protein